MKKEALTFCKYPEITKNYANITFDDREEDILDFITEFANKKKCKIFRYILGKEWKENKKYTKTIVDGVSIPRGDEYWKIIIYYQ